MGSVVVATGLQCTGLVALWHVRDLCGRGIETVSPAMAGGFSTTGPREEPQDFDFYVEQNGLKE